ncbi:hypothetical protein JTE90_014257 [Oedothorax gibbosus]|uniref:Sec1 family domain-containing protein 2 n=1 Tax=Oedothorax gibbosus TaxID=931172 RepID=A0AAV6UB18_9ARAC|nr:hypothetical protein JTE90_014257 [Oedothorax gibbosus]
MDEYEYIEGEHGDEFVLNTVRTLFSVLRRLGTLRRRFKKYQTLFKSTNPAFPASYNSLLKQLVADIFDSTLTDIPDIEFHSAGLKDYIKTGFSLFMNVSKPQPRDNSTVFIIILGGATASEIKFIQETAAQHKEHEVILGCTSILTPRDTLKDIGLVVKELMNENFEDDE